MRDVVLAWRRWLKENTKHYSYDYNLFEYEPGKKMLIETGLKGRNFVFFEIGFNEAKYKKKKLE